MLNANKCSGKSDFLVHGNDRATQRFRNKDVSDCLRLSLEQDFANFIEDNGRNQDGPIAFQIGSEEICFRVGRYVFEPAG